MPSDTVQVTQWELDGSGEPSPEIAEFAPAPVSNCVAFPPPWVVSDNNAC